MIWTKDTMDYWMVEINHIFRMLEIGYITEKEATGLLNELRKEMGLIPLDKFSFKVAK